MKRIAFVSGSLALVLGTAFVAGCSDEPGTAEQTPISPFIVAPTEDGGLQTEVGFTPGEPIPAPEDDAPALPIDQACGSTSISATARDANVLLLVDKSGSMLQTPSGFSMRKWEALKTALRSALDSSSERLALGLSLFPNDPTRTIAANCRGNCCAMPEGDAAIGVPVENGTAALPKVLAALDETAPGGATPTGKALDAALAYFTAGAGKDLAGAKYVILATDGGPNCNESLTCEAATCTTNLDGSCRSGNCCDPSAGGSRISCLDHDAVTAKISALASAGVKTFVVGIPGAEAYREYLDQFAVAGGAANTDGPYKYFAVEAAGGVAGLTATFEKITGSLITSCRLQLDAEPPTGEVAVFVDDERVAPGPDGWELDTSTSPPTVVMQGKSCDDLTAKGARAVSVVFGCPAPQIR
jgi:hypothetical protein